MADWCDIVRRIGNRESKLFVLSSMTLSQYQNGIFLRVVEETLFNKNDCQFRKRFLKLFTNRGRIVGMEESSRENHRESSVYCNEIQGMENEICPIARSGRQASTVVQAQPLSYVELCFYVVVAHVRGISHYHGIRRADHLARLRLKKILRSELIGFGS